MNKAADLKALFVSRLSMLLKELNISQSELSKQIGVRQSTISEWLNLKDRNGKEKTALPSAEALVALAEALNTSPNYLLGLSAVSHEAQNERPEQTDGMTIEELVEKKKEIDNLIRILKDGFVKQSGKVKIWKRHYPKIDLDRWSLYIMRGDMEYDENLVCVADSSSRDFVISYICGLITDLQNVYDELEGETE